MNGVGANIEHTPSKGSGSKLSLTGRVLRPPVEDDANRFGEILALGEVQVVTQAPDALAEGAGSIESLEVLKVSELSAEGFEKSTEHSDAPQLEVKDAGPEFDAIAGLATAAVVDESVPLANGAPLQNVSKRPDIPLGKAKNVVSLVSGEGGFARHAVVDIPADLNGEELIDETQQTGPHIAPKSKTLLGGDDDNGPKPTTPNLTKVEPVVEPVKNKVTSPLTDIEKVLEAKTLGITNTVALDDTLDGDDAPVAVPRAGTHGTQTPFDVSENTSVAGLQTMPKSKSLEGDVKTDVTKIKLTLDGDFAQDGSIKAESEQKPPTTINVSGPSALEIKGRDLLQASTMQPEVQQHAAKDVLPKAALALSLRDAQWGQRLVAQIEKMHTEGSARYEISLRPKNLGDMNVTLEVRGEETQVRIVTETTAASRVLIGAEDRLSQMLDAAGFKLSSLSASMGLGSQLGNGQGQPSKQKQHDMPGKSKMREGATSEVTAHRTSANQSSAINVLA